MILSEESKGSLNSTSGIENSGGIALFSNSKGISPSGQLHIGGRNGDNYPGGRRGGSGPPPSHYLSGSYNSRPRKVYVIYDFCLLRGHTRNTCYKLHGYPSDFKQKKKFNSDN